MSDKYKIEKKEVDVCKIIDFTMTINASVDVLEMKYPTQLDEFTKKHLEKIKNASINIEELLTVAIKK